MGPTLSIIVAFIAIGSSLVSFATGIMLLRYKQETLQRDLSKEEKQTQDNMAKLESSVKSELSRMSMILDQAVKDIQQALILIRLSNTEQALINKITTSTLESLTRKVEELEKAVNRNDVRLAVIEQRCANES